MRHFFLFLCACAPAPTSAPVGVTIEPLPTVTATVPTAVIDAGPPAERAPEILAPGKITVVHFFASWCAPCAKSLPQLGAMNDRFAGRVKLIAIGEDDEEPPMRAFVQQSGTSASIIWDEKKLHAMHWKVSMMPSTFVVDEHGSVRFTHPGYHAEDAAEIDSELSGL